MQMRRTIDFLISRLNWAHVKCDVWTWPKMTLSAKPSYIVYFLFGNSLSVCVDYSDLVLLTKYLWEIKSMETRGFNTTIAACVFDLVSIQNSFVAFLELKIVKCKIIYIMSPVCRPCWNLIWYQSIEFWSSSEPNFGLRSLPTTTTFPKNWNGLFADERTKYLIIGTRWEECALSLWLAVGTNSWLALKNRSCQLNIT